MSPLTLRIDVGVRIKNILGEMSSPGEKARYTGGLETLKGPREVARPRRVNSGNAKLPNGTKGGL